jgi:short-subunit dehydrogenase
MLPAPIELPSTFPYMDVGGRTALLTGATGGLGQAIATALAARGARLILSSRKTEELVKLVRAIEHDVSEISVAPLRQRALARFAMLAPEISGRLAGSAAKKAADAIASGQTEKR